MGDEVDDLLEATLKKPQQVIVCSISVLRNNFGKDSKDNSNHTSDKWVTLPEIFVSDKI
jgi:hypothetical protein